MAGDFNVANALVAAAVLHELGVEPMWIVRGLCTVTVPGRMQQVRWGQDFQAAVDYAHTPDAVERAIAAVRPGSRGRVIVVLGCGGDRDRGKRPLMGEVAARMADLLVVTDDNPRSEDPAAIRQAMLDGVERVPAAERAEVHEVGDRREAIFLAARLATGDDTVLVLGKGHETGQEVAGTVHPFQDSKVLHEAIWQVLDGGGGELVES
jgi:UDP-N-acetylmuramoyl-L-alanyl-D-glutamate--2,6-diaminopimelate ligase